jgi:hypothetical protein
MSYSDSISNYSEKFVKQSADYHLLYETENRKKNYPCNRPSRLPRFLDDRPADDSEVVSLTRRPSFIPQEHSWYSFLLEAEATPGP